MYEAHFGLSGQPFQLNPDPAFYFNSRGHGHALAYLRYGVAQGEGFIVVTGEIGAGKTTLVRTLLGELDRQQVVAAQIVSTQLDSGELLQAIITAFGIPAQGASKANMIATLEAFLTTLAAQGRRALLIVDEAQNLNPGAVEELRMLSNFQLGNQSLLQSFLIGQPELRRLLEAPDMEQLRQRVSASCHLGPLDADETRAYIEHRLLRVGWSGHPAIAAPAFDELFRWSGGVPRRINRLANRVLLASYLEGRRQIDAALVETTARELRGEIGEIGQEPAPMPARQALAAVAASPATSPTSLSAAAPGPAAEPIQRPAPAPTGPLDRDPADSGAATTTAAGSTVAAPPAPAASLHNERRDDDEVFYADLGNLSQLQPLEEIERIDNSSRAGRPTYLLALADDSASALKLAALGQALGELPDAPTLLLVTPGLGREIWPWDEMERLLPRPPLALHLGIPRASFEQLTPLLFERFGRVLGEFAPIAVLLAGASESLLAGALLAHKRGLPLARLDAGDSDPAAEQGINGQLIDQVAQRRYDCAAPGTLAQRGARGSAEARLRIQALEGSLLADVCNAVEPGITTPTGACLRNNLSIYLGPDWSNQVQGTPYAAVALCLSPLDPVGNGERIEHLLACTSVPKLLWLVDAATDAALRAWQAQAGAELADQLFIVDTSLSRDDSMYRRRLAGARLLSCRVGSLADQFSLLRGALALVSQPGHLLGEVAHLWHLPCALVHGDGRWAAADKPSPSQDLHAPDQAGGEPGGPLGAAGGLGADPASLSIHFDTSSPDTPTRLREADTLDAWLGTLASIGYAARAAQAAISAAATSSGGRGTSAASLGAPGLNTVQHPGAAKALARAISNWLRLYAPASWAIEA
jgi:putative secretion ATPase (PEP-CTERM system associated)